MPDPGIESEVRKAAGRAKVRAIIITGREERGVARQTRSDEVEKADDVGQSNVKSPWEELEKVGKIIPPPFEPFVLATMSEHSADLGPSIGAMEVNVVGFGWQLVAVPSIARLLPQPGVTNGEQKELDPLALEAIQERERFDEFLTYGNWDDESLTTLRRAQRYDLESTGYRFMELVTNAKGSPVGYRHVPAYQMRLSRLDEDETTYNDVRVIGSGTERRLETKKKRRRFRRYVQWDGTGRAVTYFKEFGDPRPISKEDGSVLEGPAAKDRSKLATPMVYSRIYAPRTPYGVPRYIGALLAILGARAAEEVNYTTFRNNNIPSMMVLVSGGQLTQETIERITTFSKEVIQGDDNYSKFLILEAEADETVDQTGTTGNVKIDAKPLTREQITDAMFQRYEDTNADKVRRSWRLPPILIGRSSDYTRSCYSADTETLTEHGWRRFDEVGDSSIATFNPSTGMIEYHPPVGGLRLYPYAGIMLQFKNRNVDQLVTPDHTMWIRQMAEGSEYFKVKAVDIDVSRFMFRTSADGFASMDAPTDIIIPEMVLTDGPNAGVRPAVTIPSLLWVEFLAAFVADGSTTPELVRGEPRHMYNVTLSAKKSRKINQFSRIFSTFGELGFRVNRSWTGDDGMTHFTLADKVLWKILREECGTRAGNKHLPAQVVHWPGTHLDRMLSTFQNTDGTIDAREGRTSWSYSTTSEELADQVQIIALHCGHRAHKIHNDDDNPVHARLYRILITPDAVECRVTAEQVSEEWYEGQVYCFEVPNHLFVTRRNGRIAVQGNTADTSRRLAEEQVFAPERVEEDWLWNRILRSMGMKFWEFRTNSPNVTDDTDLLQLLYAAEKAGAMTPRIARDLVIDILGRDVPTPDASVVDLDVPFSLQMAEAVKNQADAGEVGQQVTALKRGGDLLDLRDGLIRELRQKERALRAGSVPGVFLRNGTADRVAQGVERKITTTEKADVEGRLFALVDEVHVVGFARLASGREEGGCWTYDVEEAEAVSPYPHTGVDEGSTFVGAVGVL